MGLDRYKLGDHIGFRGFQHEAFFPPYQGIPWFNDPHDMRGILCRDLDGVLYLRLDDPKYGVLRADLLDDLFLIG